MSADGAGLDELARRIEAEGLEWVRFAWCDTHGMLRGKTLTARAAIRALASGVTMVGTVMLKDTSDRTAFKVFEPGIADELPGFEYASNLILKPVADTFRVLPWAARTGWVQCRPHFQDGRPVPFDTRGRLEDALAGLREAGYGMLCGLEVEFHIYRLREDQVWRDPDSAAWPGPAPVVELVHPGYNLLSEACADMAGAPLAIVAETARGLGLPLSSLEIELGPSQVEAVFDATDALTAADNMVLFRNGVRQALRRAGYHATFMCRPPFANVMASGWHLHQSLIDATSGRNAFMRDAPAPGTTPLDATHTLSDAGAHYLAGLLTHAPGMTVLCTPTINGFGRFRPNALAPQSILWGRDNRGAMLRVVGAAGDPATRIENRIGEPAANPYLYMAAQVHAGLAGMRGGLAAPPATANPYGAAASADAPRIPATLGDALAAFTGDTAMRAGLGTEFVRFYERVKAAELARHDSAEDKAEFERREYFARM